MFSLIISTRDRPSRLDVTLDSLFKTVSAGQSFELIIVDSCPSLHPARLIADKYGAKYIFVDTPGLSLARNVGARCAVYPYLVFIDDDISISFDSISLMLAHFSISSVAAVTARIEHVSSSPSVQELYDEMSPFSVGSEPLFLDKSLAAWVEMSLFRGLGTGAVIALRQSLLLEWPGFDIRFGRGKLVDVGEENIAWYELVSLGHRIVYEPLACAIHPLPDTVYGLQLYFLNSLRSSTAYAILLIIIYPRHLLLFISIAFRRLFKRGSIESSSLYSATAVNRLLILRSRILGLLMVPAFFLFSFFSRLRKTLC